MYIVLLQPVIFRFYTLIIGRWGGGGGGRKEGGKEVGRERYRGGRERKREDGEGEGEREKKWI